MEKNNKQSVDELQEVTVSKDNENLNLEYKGKELNIVSPCLLKLIFRKNELVNIEQIK